jgi:FMN phosphatase YigB (HAD superfamily)
MTIKAVIFDIGGVLLQSAGPKQHRAWEDRFGIQDSEVFKFVNRSGLSAAATRGKVSSDELWQQVSEHFGIDRVQIRELEKTYQANETIFLDNKIINVDGASLVGLHSIHYKDNAQAIAAIHKYIERYA